MLTATAAVYWAVNLATGHPVLPAEIPADAWPGILGVAVVAGFLAVQGFYAGAQRVGAAQASLISTVEPLWTILAASILLGERLAPIQWVGGALILVGVLLSQTRGGVRARGRQTPTSRCSPSPRSAWATSRLCRCPCATGCGASVPRTSPTLTSRPGTSDGTRRASGERRVDPAGPTPTVTSTPMARARSPTWRPARPVTPRRGGRSTGSDAGLGRDPDSDAQWRIAGGRARALSPAPRAPPRAGSGPRS